MHFADTLKAILKRDRTRQAAFAARAGLRQNEVSYYVRGAHMPGLEKLRGILAAAGNDAQELLVAYLRDITPSEFQDQIEISIR